MTYAQKHVARISRWFLWAYWAHLPLFVAIALVRGSSPFIAGALALGAEDARVNAEGTQRLSRMQTAF